MGALAGDSNKTLREFVDGDPDSQESKIVRVRSSMLSEIPGDSIRRRIRLGIGRQGLISDL